MPTMVPEPQQDRKTPTLRSVPYGGGVQSTALLVLAARRTIDFPLFLFANVGDDSENPATTAYVHEIAVPYAELHGIELAILDRHRRTGEIETLMDRLTKEGSRSVPIPVRMSNGAPGTRSCTVDFKIKVVGKELKRRGATPDRPATLAVGISLDEMHRAHNRKEVVCEQVTYPLLDLRLSRQDCRNIIEREGLPIPPKSSCFFCPFHRPATWGDMARDEPELFEKSAQLEDLLNARRVTLGKDSVYLTRFNAPLRDAISANQDLLPFTDLGDDGCDNGACFT